MTKILSDLKEWFNIRNSLTATIGFVPTMGALHKGHLSLIERCVKENKISVVSIFVNPAQFNDKNDYENYPKTFDNDFKMLKEIGVDYLLMPDYNNLYPDDYKYKVTETDFCKILEGHHRPGHFDGVLTVVLKLLNIVRSDKAYFGEKDYQQYKLIEGMTRAFFINTEVILCETIREDDGLAFSSRNVRLTKDERRKASLFPALLKSKMNAEQIRSELEKLNFKVDYVQDLTDRRYGALWVGKVRLIDNVKIKNTRAET